ncbi:MAG: glutamine amidotransferase [Alteromonadaceae bacterium]|jgi:glutamine amidotransferase
MNVIIDTGCANLLSLKSAIERLGYPVTISAVPMMIQQAERVFLPGVGTAKHAMKNLKASGLDEVIKALTQPVLGICLGMQLLTNSSKEGRNDELIDCLGIIPTSVDLLKATDLEQQQKPLRVPHMGWNTYQSISDHPVFKGISSDDYFYYVHSYGAPLSPYTIAQCQYNIYADMQDSGDGAIFSAGIAKDNFIGVQFHPERSGVMGSKLLQNFMEMAA